MADSDFIKQLFSARDLTNSRKVPDYGRVHKEMAKNGAPLSLLWNEYCEVCRLSNEIPFMYTQFCKYYREYTNSTKATMHIDHKPSEKLIVDWAGQTATIVDRNTGEVIKSYAE